MKKVSLLLALIMFFSVFSFSAFAKDEIPVTAEYSYTENGDIKIIAFISNVKKLVSLNAVLSYDTENYKLEGAKACVAADSEGNERENLTGLWVFGELSDKTGCTGAFVSFDGVTKTVRTPVCEFVLSGKNGTPKPSEITVAVKELITDDGNEENDINRSVIIPLGKEIIDASQNFEYSVKNTGVVITGVKNNPQVCFVPDLIQGLPVRTLLFKDAFESPFVVFGRSVLSVEGNVFSKNNTVIAPMDSAPAAMAKISGAKHLEYFETMTPDLAENIFYTHNYLTTDTDELFLFDCDVKITPSHKAFAEYLGTGTKITLSNNGESAEFLFSVTGDANGDSVCDVLDAVMTRSCADKLTDLEKIQKKSVDFNGDGVVDSNDYAQSVNVALGEDVKVFDGVWGDLNSDYCVDILDLVALNKLMNAPDFSAESKEKADFNNDGIVNATDKEILNELIEEFI